MTTTRIALLQLRTPASPQAALAHVEPLLREAAAVGARLIMTPECTNAVQRDRTQLLPQLTDVENDRVVIGLRALAGELDVEILVGSVLVKDGDGFTNRSLLIRADGAIAAAYDKIHMFDVDLPTGESVRESAAYRPGAAARSARSAPGDRAASAAAGRSAHCPSSAVASASSAGATAGRGSTRTPASARA